MRSTIKILIWDIKLILLLKLSKPLREFEYFEFKGKIKAFYSYLKG